MEDGTGAGGKKYQHLSHEFGPLYDGASRTLLLGSFPSVKSRDAQFYYGHPQNRFWKVLAALYGEAVPASKEEKIRFVLGHHLALWDVIESCDICGSSDASIRNAVPTDLPPILAKTEINRIFINGKTAFRLYEKYQKDRTGEDHPVRGMIPVRPAARFARNPARNENRGFLPEWYDEIGAGSHPSANQFATSLFAN